MSAVPAPAPPFSERARTLVHLGRQGALATASRRHGGHPFASVMPYAADERGQPLLLVSAMAVHTQNLQADPRASLLVAEAAGTAEDALAAGRVTLMGTAARVAAEAVAAARDVYLARHPAAAAWVDFGDFAFWRLEVAQAYLVAGFGAMGWIAGEDYAAAPPDPLADASASIVEHMNRDHPGALVELARLAGQSADAAAMTSVDRLGFGLRVRAGGDESRTRVAFPREIRSPDDARGVLVEMLREARRRPPA